MLLISLSEINLFVGVGGSLVDRNSDNDTGGNFSDDEIVTDDAIGFSVTNASLELATIKPNLTAVQAGDTRSYMGLELGVAQAELLGLEDIPLIFRATDVLVQVNQASGTTNGTTGTLAARLDWTTALATNTGDLPSFSGTDGLSNAIELHAEGTVALDVAGFVVGQGSFAITKGTVDLDLNGNGFSESDPDDLNDAPIMVVSLSGVDLFVGVGGSLDDNGTPQDFADDGIATDDAVGFAVEDAGLELAIVKPGLTQVQGGEHA